MRPALRKLEVRLEHGPGEDELVGHLAEHARTIYFEYDAGFLASQRSHPLLCPQLHPLGLSPSWNSMSSPHS